MCEEDGVSLPQNNPSIFTPAGAQSMESDRELTFYITKIEVTSLLLIQRICTFIYSGEKN